MQKGWQWRVDYMCIWLIFPAYFPMPSSEVHKWQHVRVCKWRWHCSKQNADVGLDWCVLMNPFRFRGMRQM
jgi:hypothetical protein